MANDLWRQFAGQEVPAPPVEFDRQLHKRVNRSLLALQLADFAVRAMPWAMLHFARAVLGAISFTIAGRYPGRPNDPQL